jgi:hypothetical protein
MKGGIGFGLSAILHGELTLDGGRVEQTNYDTFRVLTIDEMPDVEVHIVPSEAAPTGVGEPGVPPIGPAVANAIFAATGKRIRTLPLAKHDLRCLRVLYEMSRLIADVAFGERHLADGRVCGLLPPNEPERPSWRQPRGHGRAL